MRTSRAFRPNSFDHRLEDRMVLSHLAPRVAAHYQSLHANLLGNSRVGAANHQLNLGMAENSATLATAHSFAAALNGSVARSVNVSNARATLLRASQSGLSGGLSTIRSGTNGFIPTTSNLGATLGLGAQNGLLFNNGLGTLGSTVFNSPGLQTSTGLAFNNGLGTPGTSTGQPINNNLGTAGLTTVGLATNAGFGLANTFIGGGTSTIGNGFGSSLGSNSVFSSMGGTLI